MRDNSPCYKLGRSVGGDPAPMDNLRLEINKDCFYVLSYHHVELAKFESAQGAARRHALVSTEARFV